MFYPYGDERLRCSETLRVSGVRFVVNTEALFRHLVDGPEPLPNLGTDGVWFEPAFLAAGDRQRLRHNGKRNFLFYARPNNLRNLYWRGLEAMEACIEEGILDPEAWDIHFVGRDLEDIVLPRGVRPRLAQNLPWGEYLSLVRQMDVDLSLMDTPHRVIRPSTSRRRERWPSPIDTVPRLRSRATPITFSTSSRAWRRSSGASPTLSSSRPIGRDARRITRAIA